MEKRKAMEEHVIRRKRNVGETGRISWAAISKMQTKSEATAENKRNIRSAAYIATKNTGGAYLTSSCQKKN
jgi:hypothetical protein